MTGCSAIQEVRRDRDWDLRFYSRIAPVYEVWTALAESRARGRVLAIAGVSDGEAVLEVAVGTDKQLAGDHLSRDVVTTQRGPNPKPARRQCGGQCRFPLAALRQESGR